jgi:ketosteroid isomerase-like protein
MEKTVKEIDEIVNRETNAWDTQDVGLLMSIFHPDMVWPWPRTSNWQNLFDTHKLVHNKREIKKIEVSKEQDGAFAVVDIDTLWINEGGQKNHWKGRVCKVYTKIRNEWKLIMHTGVLDYS